MGMDVYGKNPSSPTGEYFSSNVWWWRPLADYVLRTAPTIARDCKSWHTNDGAGLNAAQSLALAAKLQEEIDTGRCEKYASEFEAARKALPRERCELCDGSGVRRDQVGVDNGMPDKLVPVQDAEREQEEGAHPRAGQVGWCNGCDGRGTKVAIGARYPFSVENVSEFVKFLQSCGGFEIC